MAYWMCSDAVGSDHSASFGWTVPDAAELAKFFGASLLRAVPKLLEAADKRSPSDAVVKIALGR